MSYCLMGLLSLVCCLGDWVRSLHMGRGGCVATVLLCGCYCGDVLL